jgi:hypothetical protein
MNRPAQPPDTVLETWAVRNGSAALQWLNDHTQLLQWPRLLEKVITGVAITDFQEAASLALEVGAQRSETAPALFCYRGRAGHRHRPTGKRHGPLAGLRLPRRTAVRHPRPRRRHPQQPAPPGGRAGRCMGNVSARRGMAETRHRCYAALTFRHAALMSLFDFSKPPAAATSGKAEATRRIKQWVETFGVLGDDGIVHAAELQCHEPGCPDFETVITLMYSTPSQDRTVKIFKPLDEVLAAILQSFSSGPPACPCC